MITLSGPEWDHFLATALTGTPPTTITITPTTSGGRTLTAPDGTTLTYTPTEWNAFLNGAADGEFHRPTTAHSQPSGRARSSPRLRADCDRPGAASAL